MAESTGIEWCDATFNPWWGCERVSPACAHCYADEWAARFGLQLWGPGHGFRFFGDKHWQEPLKWARTLPAKLGRRPRVFCASMADVFEERDEVDEPRRRLFELIDATPELDWLILTKRPEVARDWLSIIDVPIPNVWMGVSIENARFTWRADVLRKIPAAVRFISAEPLLGSLFEGFDNPRKLAQLRGSGFEPEQRGRAPLDLTGIDWIIVGGESGPKARPFHLEHAREIIGRAQFEREGMGHPRPAVFVKQLGAKPLALFDDLGIGVATERALRLRDRKGGDWSEWPADLRIREFPQSRATNDAGHGGTRSGVAA